MQGHLVLQLRISDYNIMYVYLIFLCLLNTFVKSDELYDIPINNTAGMSNLLYHSIHVFNFIYFKQYLYLRFRSALRI